MITKFTVKGFRNFEQKIEFDLTKVQDFEFNSFAIKNGIIKNGIIYGPNGCGKSNLSIAIFDIIFHLADKFKGFALENYTFAGSQSILVTFEYDFNFDGQIIKYTYSKNYKGELKEEKLFVDEKQIFSRMQDFLR